MDNIHKTLRTTSYLFTSHKWLHGLSLSSQKIFLLSLDLQILQCLGFLCVIFEDSASFRVKILFLSVPKRYPIYRLQIVLIRSYLAGNAYKKMLD